MCCVRLSHWIKITYLLTYLQVCSQLRTHADNVSLPVPRAAAAAERRPGRAAMDRYLLHAGPTAANLQQYSTPCSANLQRVPTKRPLFE